MEEQQYPKQALDKFRQWHFWWLVVFSLLLVVTFVWYLPIRFLQQADMPHEMIPGTMSQDENVPHGHGEPVASSMASPGPALSTMPTAT